MIGFEPIEGGHGNSSFLIKTSQNKYVLTVFDDKPKKHVRLLGKLLLYLKQYDFSTTQLVTLPPTHEVTTTYQGKPVILKKFISGKVHAKLSDKMLFQVGEEMATLHKIPAPDFLAGKHPFGKQLFPFVINEDIDPEYEEWLQQQIEYINENYPPAPPEGLIHGDLFYDNILFEELELKAVIDFEEACRYPFGFDLGMAIVGLCRKENNLQLDRAKALIAGYQKVRKLQLTEKQKIKFFVNYAATAISYWRFWKYRIHEPMPENANKHREMMRFVQRVKHIPVNQFNQIVKP